MNRNQTRKKSSDVVVVLTYIALVFFGVIAIYASVYAPGLTFFDVDSKHFRQVIWFGVCLFAGLIIMVLDGNFFSALAYFIYAISMLSLVLVIFFGQKVAGGVSWFNLGLFKLQPSEFAKFATCLMLAKYIVRTDVNLKRFTDLAWAFGIIALPAALIVWQGDSGTAIVFFSLVLVLYRSGMPAWILYLGIALIFLSLIALLFENQYLLIAFGILGALLSLMNIRKNRRIIPYIIGGAILFSVYVFMVNFAFENVLKPHQQNRINVLLGKIDDLKDAAYNVYQSKIAIGSGGFSGKGFLNGTQTKFDFVPELSTDFIFCTVGEEFGFMGSFILIVLYMVLLYRIVFIAERQRSAFSNVFAYSVASIIFCHFVINMGMTIGLVPVIGIPLPFISYGGSSLLGFSILIFILLKFDTERYNIVR